MKKKIILTIFTFLAVLVLPFTSAKAENYVFGFKRMPLDGIVAVMPNNGSGLTLNGHNVSIGNHQGHYTLEIMFAKETDTSTFHRGYCLHAGKQVYTGATLGLHSGFGDLIDSNGSRLDETRQTILKNILASSNSIIGTTPIDDIVGGSLAEKGDNSVGTCNNSDKCTTIFATQLLVWEVMTGSRYDYTQAPPAVGSFYYQDLINNGSNNKLKTMYNKILAGAEDLTKEVKFSSSGTFTLKWSDAQGKYISDKIDLGVFNIDKSSLPAGVTVSSKDENNKVVISSTKEVSGTIKVTHVKGNTTNQQEFKWFKFLAHSDAQDIVMGNYSITQTSSFNIKTESGKIKVNKVDSVTKKILKGAKFNLYKCKSSTSCTGNNKTFIKTIDLTNKAYSDYITIKKSGKYLLEETIVPYGYTGLGEFTFNISIDNGNTEIKSISNEIANLQVSNGTIIKNSLVVGNKPKNITIKKVTVVEENGKSITKAVKGATFKITDKKGNLIKFSKDKTGVYRYDTNGEITEIQDDSSSEYMITLLPKGDYVIIETAVPYPYTLANKAENRKNYIRIDDDSNLSTCDSTYKKCTKVSSATITVKNFTTKVSITKYGSSGKKLPKVKFELYDSKKENKISVTETKVGRYKYSTLIYGNIISNETQYQLLETDEKGNIIIDNLPAGTYYLKEVEASEGYVIDEKNQWTKFTLTVTKTEAKTVYVSISNAKSEFTFYKIDEDGNYLSDGLFKLQAYNEKTSKFEDVPVIYHEKENYYTIDKTGKSDIYTFTPIDGTVTFKEVDSNKKYRVVEIEAPEGYVLPKGTEAYVEIEMNENGYALGDSILVNRKIVVEEEANAQAELIINISTGQDRIKYTLIISGILIILIGLFILKRKLDK